MGDGLKRVAKLCGGLTVKAGGVTARYNGDGKLIKTVRPQDTVALFSDQPEGVHPPHATSYTRQVKGRKEKE